jgi:tagaturonate reductase
MLKLTNELIGKPRYKEKILQFGEGNFLRAFVDLMIDRLNEAGFYRGSFVVVQPIERGMVDKLNEQDGLYTIILRGLDRGREVDTRRIITSISRGINPYADFDAYIACAANPDLRFVVSNTTEAGIVHDPNDKLTDKPQASFPAKVTAFLYERFKAFGGDRAKGLVFIPCELIDNNGAELRRIVLQYADEWRLGAEFTDWVETANYFTNTLVDRIVTGYPKDEAESLWSRLGYRDELITAAEIFHHWVIEYPKMPNAEGLAQELPFARAGFNVLWTDDVTPYKTRKVRILNGAHTASVLAAYLAGKRTVGEMMDDEWFNKFIHDTLYEEIIPTIEGYLPYDELKSFADSVFDRFRNPYIKHYLFSIALNSVSKFKARVLPSVIEYMNMRGVPPKNLTLSFAALIAFYKGGNDYQPQDDADVLEFFDKVWSEWDGSDDGLKALTVKVCANDRLWGTDLTTLDGFAELAGERLCEIITHPEQPFF